jgi:hypothetical protein
MSMLRWHRAKTVMALILAIAYPKLVYSPAGQTLRENLWNETVAELHFAGAGKIPNGLK